MKKTILITGLDGCGKSTLFSRLKLEKPDYVSLITLPHIDEDGLSHESGLKKHARLLNRMSAEADKNSWSDLKALALFGSMLLYQKLEPEIANADTGILICERHPLIDPLVYAKFYAQRIGPDRLNRERMDYYNQAYEELLAFFTDVLPLESHGDYALDIFSFIHEFFKDAMMADEKTKALFKVDLPDTIFFLKAPAEILFERIALRKVPEPHEKTEILAVLDKAYDALFEEVSAHHKTIIEYIDASQFENLDAFYNRLTTEIIKL